MKLMSEATSAKVIAAADKMTSNRYIKIIMDSFLMIGSLQIGAAFFTVLTALPLGKAYSDFLQSTGLYEILNYPILITSQMISLYLVAILGYKTAKSFDKSPTTGLMVSMVSFLILIPQEITTEFTTKSGEEISSIVSEVLPISSVGASSIFLALIVGILATRIFVFLDDKNLKIKMPASVPENVAGMFESMIPLFSAMLVFLIVRVACEHTPYGDAANMISSLIQMPISSVGAGTGGAFVYFCFAQFLWLFGIHGNMITYVALSPIISATNNQNIAAYAKGLPLPNIPWEYDAFVLIGGAGCTLALVILMLIRARSKHLKMLGKLALPASIFGINEPVLFGAPIVLNPFLAVPFVLCPIVNFALMCFANNIIHFAVPVTGGMQEVYLPLIAYESVLTNGWEGPAMVLLLLVIDIAIYYPFFKAYDNNQYQKELELEQLQLEQGKEEEEDDDDDLI